MPWRGTPSLSINVILEMDGLNIDHVNVFSCRDGEVVGKDGDFIAVDLDSVVLVEDVFLLGELGGHWEVMGE